MSTTEETVEQTLAKSRDLAEQLELLERQINDPGRQIEPLFAELEQECARLGEALQTKGSRPGTGYDALAAAMEMLADFGAAETKALEVLDGPAGGSSKPAAPARPAQRRGLRI